MIKIEEMVLEIVQKLLDSQKDIRKFDKGNQRAGIRIRAMLKEVRIKAHETRMEIQRIKHRRKKERKKAREEAQK